MIRRDCKNPPDEEGRSQESEDGSQEPEVRPRHSERSEESQQLFSPPTKLPENPHRGFTKQSVSRRSTRSCPFRTWRLVRKRLRLGEVPRHPARGTCEKSALVILSEAKNLSSCSRLQPNCQDSSLRRKSRHSRESGNPPEVGPRIREGGVRDSVHF